MIHNEFERPILAEKPGDHRPTVGSGIVKHDRVADLGQRQSQVAAEEVAGVSGIAANVDRQRERRLIAARSDDLAAVDRLIGVHQRAGKDYNRAIGADENAIRALFHVDHFHEEEAAARGQIASRFEDKLERRAAAALVPRHRLGGEPAVCFDVKRPVFSRRHAKSAADVEIAQIGKQVRGSSKSLHPIRQQLRRDQIGAEIGVRAHNAHAMLSRDSDCRRQFIRQEPEAVRGILFQRCPVECAANAQP